MVAILGFDRAQILDAVRAMYTEVARSPDRTFHFPTGRSACLFVGYPEPWLDALPATAVESFAGVGFPFRAGVIREGDRVLDVGAGSGTDALTAARLVGPAGRVFALDMTPGMLDKLFSTHPPTRERIEHIRHMVEESHLPSGLPRDTPEYRDAYNHMVSTYYSEAGRRRCIESGYFEDDRIREVLPLLASLAGESAR